LRKRSSRTGARGRRDIRESLVDRSGWTLKAYNLIAGGIAPGSRPTKGMRPFQGRCLILALIAWALPKAIASHAFSVKISVTIPLIAIKTQEFLKGVSG
jgi:hypothetical protein